MKYYLPILLNSDFITSLKIDTDIILRKITSNEKKDFFGIKEIQYKFLENEVFINKIELSKTNNGRYSYKKNFTKHSLDNTEEIFASNYVIEIETNEENVNKIARNLNLSFNISMPTKTRCYLKFKHNDTDAGFSPNAERSLTALNNLDFKRKRDLEDFPIIYKKIKALSEKERLRFDLFFDGIHSQASIELRFLSLIMALENMFLPENGLELKLRFALRIAQINNNKISKKNKKEIFELAEKIYKIRCKIIHTGGSKDLTRKIYAETINLLWVSLVEYINFPDKFKEQYLNDILLSHS